MVLEYFLGNMLGYFVRTKFCAHTLPLLKNHRFVTHEPQNFHLRGFSYNFIYNKYILSENMFLKTYKKNIRIALTDFSKKTKMWAKITLKYYFLPKPIFFYMLSLLASIFFYHYWIIWGVWRRLFLVNEFWKWLFRPKMTNID